MYDERCSLLACKSRTAKLWIQYYRQITLMRRFIRAERWGNWTLHLETVREMIPHFLAASYLAYAKYAHLYLQQMSDLENKMTEDGFHEFSSSGSFTIRRSAKLWAGVWNDIEQVLMRAMRSSGCLTHDRGLIDSALTLRNFAELNLRRQKSEQHVGMCEWRLEADRMVHPSSSIATNPWIDVHKYWCHRKWHHQLRCFCGDWHIVDEQDCWQNICIGMIEFFLCQPPTAQWKYSKRHGRSTPCNSSAGSYFCVAKSDEDVASYLKLELGPLPISHFDDISMRKTDQAYQVVKSLCGCVSSSAYHQGSMFVMDGGYLYYIGWYGLNMRHSATCTMRMCAIYKHFCASCNVIFDGSSDGPGTKGMEQERRAIKVQSSDIQFLGRYDRNSSSRAPMQRTRLCLGWSRGHWVIRWKGSVFKWRIRCRHTNRAHRNRLVTDHRRRSCRDICR